ncbi:MAG: hypothetical protein V3V33_16860 [Candidatus Lokiarchaeia archaeon]
MSEQNEIENSNTLAPMIKKGRYTLHFDEVTEGKIQDFCEIFSIELKKFIVNTVGYFLFIIEDDIESNAYDLIGGYFDVSKFRSEQPTGKTPKASEKKITIEIEFPHLISKAIWHLTDEIPPTPEEFIEDTVKWSIADIISKIKKYEYDFLDKYKDFSKVQKSTQQIYEQNLL